MTLLSTIAPSQDITTYARDLASLLFKNIYRKTGLPYTSEHLERMADLASNILLDTTYFRPAIASSWLHDVVEDIENIDVQAPPRDPALQHPEKTYLNSLLEEAGADGEMICYIVDCLTHRKGTSYLDYFTSIFSFSDSSPHHNLDIIAAVLKLIDRSLNTNPDEERNINELLTQYDNLDWNDPQAITAFLKKTKTHHAFLKKGYFSKDNALFAQSLHDQFTVQQQAIAIDNLSLYLPFAEQKLLAELPEDNGLFDHQKLRALLKQAYLDSIELYPGIDPFHVVAKLGANKKRVYPNGYASILAEITDEHYS